MASAPTTPDKTRPAHRLPGRYALPLVIWTFWLAYASLAPPSGLPHVEFAYSDKLGHVVMFAIWGALWLRAWVREGAITTGGGVLALAIATGWGYYLEILQSFTDYRTFDLYDLAADALGALIGILVFAAWRRKFGAST